MPTDQKEKFSFDSHVGKKLRNKRVQLKLTQTDVAHSSNKTFQQVQKYEKGTNGCSAYRLLQIANAFKVSVDYIYALALGVNYDVRCPFIDDRFVKIAELKLDKNNDIIIMEKPLILTNEVKENKKQN